MHFQASGAENESVQKPKGSCRPHPQGGRGRQAQRPFRISDGSVSEAEHHPPPGPQIPSWHLPHRYAGRGPSKAASCIIIPETFSQPLALITCYGSWIFSILLF